MSKFWKILAIVETIILVIGVTLLYLKMAMPINFHEVISTLACAFMLIGFIGGTTGWLIILAILLEGRRKNAD